MKTDLPPDEEALVKMLATAFDRLPEPDVTRITALEQRLDRQLRMSQNRRKHPALYWWMLGGLFATGAAAWWAGDYYWGEKDNVIEIRQDRSILPQNVIPQSPAMLKDEKVSPTPDAQEQNQHEDAGGEKTKQPSVIYRRESY